MKLTIVTICRNDAAGLARTLRSTFEGQSGFSDWEQIVVDGASTDGSFAELDRYRGDPHLGWCVSEPDRGIYNAMNKGAAHARGDYLLFLNAGDTLLPDVLAKVFSEPWKADVAYGDILVEMPGKTVCREMEEAEGEGATYFLFRSLPHQSTLFARRLHERLGGYDESLRVYADRKFCLRAILECGATFKRFPFAVSRFVWGGVSSDPAREAERRRECRDFLTPFFGRTAVKIAMGDPRRPDFALDEENRMALWLDKSFRPFLRDVAKAARRFYLEKPDRPVPEGGKHSTGPDDVRLAVEFLDAAAALRGHPRLTLFVRHALHWLAKRLRGRKSARSRSGRTAGGGRNG